MFYVIEHRTEKIKKTPEAWVLPAFCYSFGVSGCADRAFSSAAADTMKRHMASMVAASAEATARRSASFSVLLWVIA